MKTLLSLALFCLFAFHSSATSPPVTVDPIPSDTQLEAPAEAPELPWSGAALPVFLQGPLPTGDDDGGGGGGGAGGGYTCQASVTCPGSVELGIQPYTNTCYGQYSCTAYPSVPIVKCDGFYNCCFPGPC